METEHHLSMGPVTIDPTHYSGQAGRASVKSRLRRQLTTTASVAKTVGVSQRDCRGKAEAFQDVSPTAVRLIR